MCSFHVLYFSLREGLGHGLQAHNTTKLILQIGPPYHLTLIKKSALIQILILSLILKHTSRIGSKHNKTKETDKV